MRIRIATRAWNRAEGAETFDETTTGVMMPWIELDGHRFTDVSDAKIDVRRDGFMEVAVSVIGTVEIVYLDAEGNEVATRYPTRLPLEMSYANTVPSGYVAEEDPHALGRADRPDPTV